MTTHTNPASQAPVTKSSGCLPSIAAAGVSTLVVFLVALISTHNASALQADAAADLACMCGSPLLLLAAASGLVWRIGRRPGIVATALVLVLLVVYAALMVVPVLTRPPPRLVTARDRAQPAATTSGDHQTYAWAQLGVELDLPLGLEPAAEASAVVAFADAHATLADQITGWQWARGDEQVAVIFVCDRAYVHIDGFLDHMATEARMDVFGHGARVVSDTAASDGGRDLVLQGGGVVEHAHVVAFRRPDAAWSLTVVAVAADEASAARLVTGLRVAP